MRLPRVVPVERLTPLRMLVAAVASLAVAVGTVVYGHVAASPVGPWLSIALSAAAVACTVAALVLPSQR